jgi:hypothetical protein
MTSNWYQQIHSDYDNFKLLVKMKSPSLIENNWTSYHGMLE